MKYRKKPIVIEAIKLSRKYFDLCLYFVIPDHHLDYNSGEFAEDDCYINIKTLEGTMKASEGDYIIKGIKGEFYPCKADIFEASYEEVIEG